MSSSSRKEKSRAARLLSCCLTPHPRSGAPTAPSQVQQRRRRLLDRLLGKVDSSSADTDLEAAKTRFLKENREDYGYGGRIDELFAHEIAPRLPAKEHYLDYTGAGLYWESQLEHIKKEMSSFVFGNPHSINPSSYRCTELVESMRLKLLHFLGADPEQYELVFTRSATGALREVGELFPFTTDSHLAYLQANHKSVLGIRQYAKERQASWGAVSEGQVEGWLAGDGPDLHSANLTGCQANASGTPVYSLFAYPACDNHNGVLYPTRWVREVQAKSSPGHRWMVMLDTAAFAPSHPINLMEINADFICLSFYKLFGFPTGVGALVMKKEAASLLKKVYWGGSSASEVGVQEDWYALSHGAHEFEDGTLPFMEIINLQHGLDVYAKLGGPAAIERHVGALGRYMWEEAAQLKHSNGAPLLKINGMWGRPNSDERQGSTLNFNILDPQGNFHSHRQVSLGLAEAGFHVRDGCMCNPGGAMESIGLREVEVEALFRKRTAAGLSPYCDWIVVQRNAQCGPGQEPQPRLVRLPMGTLRASLGSMSRFEDVYALLHWLEESYQDVAADSSFEEEDVVGWVPENSCSPAAAEAALARLASLW